jgi:hypothetical protein
MFQPTADQKTRFEQLREAARAKVAEKAQAQPATLEEAFSDDATFSEPMSVEAFIAEMGLEGGK